MEETSTGPATILQFRQDIEEQFRRHIRDALDVALAEELAAALASGLVEQGLMQIDDFGERQVPHQARRLYSS